MALSRKGLRPIVVDGNNFHWKFAGKVFVIPDEDEKSLLTIDFGRFDVWLYVNDAENRPPEFEPRVVTPKFVAESIQYAKTIGWPKGRIEIEFKEACYRLKQNSKAALNAGH